MRVVREKGRCRVCRREVVLVRDDIALSDGTTKTSEALFHKTPLCGSFDRDVTSAYARESVEWPKPN